MVIPVTSDGLGPLEGWQDFPDEDEYEGGWIWGPNRDGGAAVKTEDGKPPSGDKGAAERRQREKAAAEARDPPPRLHRDFRVPQDSVGDLLAVWEFTQVKANNAYAAAFYIHVWRLHYGRHLLYYGVLFELDPSPAEHFCKSRSDQKSRPRQVFGDLLRLPPFPLWRLEAGLCPKPCPTPPQMPAPAAPAGKQEAGTAADTEPQQNGLRSAVSQLPMCQPWTLLDSKECMILDAVIAF